MTKITQKLVIVIDPPNPKPEFAFDVSHKAGNMLMNRFLIDEDASFELSGVYYLKFPSSIIDLTEGGDRMPSFDEYTAELTEQGMGYLALLTTL